MEEINHHYPTLERSTDKDHCDVIAWEVTGEPVLKAFLTVSNVESAISSTMNSNAVQEESTALQNKTTVF